MLNIANGPGNDWIPQYLPVIEATQAAGIEVIGYVDTDNGMRPHSDVLEDIDRYRIWYSPSGFLFDRADVRGDGLHAYYEPLYDHVKMLDAKAKVILNPGVSVGESFMSVADIVIEFEGPCDRYLARAPALQKWRIRHDPARFWHIVYDVPRLSLKAVLRAARARRTGWLYITDQALQSPRDGHYLYDRLPDMSMWQELTGLLGGGSS